MTTAEFINMVDWEGGIYEAFRHGLDLTSIETRDEKDVRLLDVLTNAKTAFDNFEEFVSVYYDMVETGDF